MMRLFKAVLETVLFLLGLSALIWLGSVTEWIALGVAAVIVVVVALVWFFYEMQGG